MFIGNHPVTVSGDDAKTFQAAIIEYSKEQPAAKVHCLHRSLTFAAYTHTSYVNLANHNSPAIGIVILSVTL